MNTAFYIYTIRVDSLNEQRLYKLDPALPVVHVDDDGRKFVRNVEYVVVSAAYNFGRPETFIFEADDDGNIVSWLELPGSVRGVLDFGRALLNAGYQIALPT